MKNSKTEPSSLSLNLRRVRTSLRTDVNTGKSIVINTSGGASVDSAGACPIRRSAISGGVY